MKEPKRYECLECGAKSKRCKVWRPTPYIGFARCYKCRGTVKERQEWLDWLHDQQRRQIDSAKMNGDGKILGVNIV